MREFGPGDRLFLVDASSFIYRAHFASLNGDPVYNQAPDGSPIGALRIFMERLFWFRAKGVEGRRPTHMGMIFDYGRRSFRHEIYPAYKSNRPETPPELKRQMPLMRQAATALGICAVEQEGYEADDLIATYAFTGAEAGGEVLIVSSDKDLLQLIQPGVMMFDPETGLPDKPGYRPPRWFRCDEDVINYEKVGVPPRLVAEMQALAGDPGDKIPGIPKLGPKTAAKLIMEHGSLEAVLRSAPLMPKLKGGGKSAVQIAIETHAESARMSLRLTGLCGTVDYEIPIEKMLLDDIDHDTAIEFCRANNLATMANRLEEDRPYQPGKGNF